MSYSPSEKAVYLSIAIGTSVAIFLIAMNYNTSTNTIVTLVLGNATYHAVKTPSLNHAVQLDGYLFKMLSREDGFGCEGLTIQVISAYGKKSEFKTCGSQGVTDPDSTWLIRYEEGNFGFAYNEKEQQGYFIVKSSNSHDTNTFKSTSPPGPTFPVVPEFTDAEKKWFMDKAMSVPGIKAWSDKWQWNYADFSGTSAPVPQWQMMALHLYLPPDIPAPKKCDIGWEAIVAFDLATGKIIHTDYPDMNTECHRAKVVLGNPDL